MVVVEVSSPGFGLLGRTEVPNSPETFYTYRLDVESGTNNWRLFIDGNTRLIGDSANGKNTLAAVSAGFQFGDFTFGTMPDGTRTAEPKYSKV